MHNFNIPPQKADNALEKFAKQTNFNFIYAIEDIESIETKVVSGKYSPTQALEVMLEGTGLVFQHAGDETISIKKDHHQAQVEPQPKADASTVPDKKAEPISAAPEAIDTKRVTQLDKSSTSMAEKAEGESWDDYMLEDTVVTASKREVKVQSIPMSIQALTGESLEKIGAAGFEDFIDRIPGLTINSSGLGIDSLQIRGIASYNNSVNATATVGYYIDDTPISDAMMAPDAVLFDLERIEVLKGPQGTLYGEGSLGGTVRLITRKPKLNLFPNRKQSRP
ncbi:MAG: TonB-dependent receptor plug domain-containing protein [Deltaproteobacteria bacterium]|nr:TonB-dependent receptor plug domain-containing protein [Deltaproteobacteria bacterium]